MSLEMRIILIVASVLSMLFLIRNIRKSNLTIEYSIFWIFLSIVLVLLGVFPQIATKSAGLLGIASPVNLIYLVIIFILLVYSFVQTVRISNLECKINSLAEEIAIKEHDIEKVLKDDISDDNKINT